MKKYSKLIVLLTVAIFVLGFAGLASAASTTSDDAKISTLKALGIVEGDEGGLRLDDNITRAEFAAVVVRELGLKVAAGGSTSFTDVREGHWATGYINVAVGKGIVKGYPDGTFKPEANVTNAEALTMLVRMLGYGPSVSEANWPASYLSKAATIGVTDGVSFVANVPATREQVFEMAANALDIDLMKQTQWGSETVYEETEGETVLTEYFDIDQIDQDWADDNNDGVLPLVDKTPKVAIGDLEGNELEFADYKRATTFTVAAGIDPNEFLGQRVEFWVNDDDEIVWMAADDDQETLVDTLDENVGYKTGKVTLKDEDDSFKVLNDAVIYVDNVKYSGEDFLADFDGELDDAYIKVVLNEDDEVIFADIKDYSSTAALNKTYLVKDVDDEVIEYYDLSGGESELDLDDEDYLIVKNGTEISIDKLDEFDVIRVFENTDKDTYYIEAFDKKVSGEIEDYNTDAIGTLGKYDLEINGKKYDIADIATLSTNDNEDIEELDADDVKDLVGEDATVYLNAQDKIVHVVTDADVYGRNVAIIEKSPVPEYVGDEYTMTLLTKDGVSKQYTFDPEDVSFSWYDANGKKQTNSEMTDADVAKLQLSDSNKVIAVEYQVDSSDDLTKITLLNNDPDFGLAKTGQYGSSDLDKDDNLVYIDGQGYFKVTKDTVVFDAVTKVITQSVRDAVYTYYKLDDAGVTTFAKLADKDDVKFNYLVDDDEVDYIFATYADGDSTSITSDYLFGMVTGFTSVGNDDAIKIMDAEGDVHTYKSNADVPRRSFVQYTVDSDGDEIDKIEVMAYEVQAPADQPGLTGFEDVDVVDQMKVDSVSSSAIKGFDVNSTNSKRYIINSDTVFFNLDDGKIVSTAGKDDYVRVIDTDDDGYAINYVLIIEEDFFKPDNDNNNGSSSTAAITAAYSGTDLTITVTNVTGAFAVRVYDVDTNEPLGGYGILDASGNATISGVSENPVFVKVIVYDSSVKEIVTKTIAVQ